MSAGRKVGAGTVQELDFESELLEWVSALGSGPELPLLENGEREGGKEGEGGTTM